MNNIPEEVLSFNRNICAAVAAEPLVDLGTFQIFFEICHLTYANPNVAVPEHQHPHFQLAIPVAGAMKVSCDSVCNELTCSNGNIAVLPPFTLHRYNFDSAGKTFYISVALNVKALEPLPRDLLEKMTAMIVKDDFLFRLSEAQRLLLAGALKKDENENIWNARLRTMKLKVLIGEMFLSYLERCEISGENELSNRDLDRIELIRHRIANRLNSKSPPLAYVAKCCDLSPRHVNRIFKAAVGKTVNAYWLERKLELTDQLLTSSDMPISDVADTLGFHRQSLFCDFCRRHWGMSPTEYRNKRGNVRKAEVMS